MKPELGGKVLFAALVATVVVGSMVSGVAVAEELSPWMVRVRLLDVVTERNNTAGGGIGADTLKVSDQAQPEVDVTYFFTKNIAAELVATYPVSHSINLSGADIGGLKELPPTLNLQYHFDPLGNAIPYIGAGMTYMRTWDSRAAGGALTTSQSNWGGDLQIGMDYAIDQHWSFNVDVKKVWISTDVQTPGGSSVVTANINPLLAGVGVGYHF
ncbi:MAG: OmpW family protein [Betaproteobacteria bacterium]|nr:OmpW family protein [Betaproteobacteria bacterium]